MYVGDPGLRRSVAGAAAPARARPRAGGGLPACIMIVDQLLLYYVISD